MNHPFHVLVAGGGIGGLCLAHGLRRAGVGVSVFERDPAPDAHQQAFRIHIRSDAAMAMHDCAPPAVWEAFLANAGVSPTGLAFVTDQLRVLASEGDEHPGPDGLARWGYPISRVTLRRVLMGGLEDTVQFGREVVRYELTDDGLVKAFCSDGSSASGDVLVGADGFHSAVRRQLLPSARVEDVDVLSLAGKFMLTERSAGRLPRAFRDWMTIVLPPSGYGMFIARFQRRPESEVQAKCTTSLTPDAGALPQEMPDHVFWGLAANAEHYAGSEDLRRMDGVALQQLALYITQECHPAIRRLITESDPTTLISITAMTSTPVEQWETTRVTLLGDAIHTMTPFQGLGGNTAILDARRLCDALIDVAAGRQDVIPALHAYERAMLPAGFGAVHRSLRAARMSASTNSFARSLFTTALRASNVVPPLKSYLLAS
jgi:salicylate hydroxylase